MLTQSKQEYSQFALPSTPTQALIFDMDGVLVHSEEYSHRVWANILSDYGKSLPENNFETIIGMPREASAAKVIDMADLPLEIEELVEIRRQRLVDMLPNSNLEAVPGLFDLLDTLKNNDIPCAVASNNNYNFVHKMLEVIGIKDYFEHILTGDDVVNGKPAPDIFLKAAKHLNTAPENCLVIEDSPHGVEAAVAAGIYCVAIPNIQLKDSDFSRAQAIFESMEQFFEMLPFFIPALNA